MQKGYITLLYPFQCCQILFSAFIFIKKTVILKLLFLLHSHINCNVRSKKFESLSYNVWLHIFLRHLRHLLIYKLKRECSTIVLQIMLLSNVHARKLIYFDVYSKKNSWFLIRHHILIWLWRNNSKIVLLFDNYLTDTSGSSICISRGNRKVG